MKVLPCLLFFSVVYASYDEYSDTYDNGGGTVGEDFSYEHELSDDNYGRGQGYGPHAGGNFGKMGYGGDRGFKSASYGGYSGQGGRVGQYQGGGGNPLVMEAMYNGPNQKVAGGRFGLGYGGIKSAIAPIVNSAYQGNFSPMKKFGMGGFGGHENYAGGEINNYLKRTGQRPVDPDDLDGDNVPDFLTATKHKIDNYIAKQWLLGRRKLTVSVNYANMPLEYLYLSQYHGFPNPVAGTPLGKKFGLTTKPNDYNDPKTPGVYSKAPKKEKKYMKKLERPSPPPKKGGYSHDEKPKDSYGSSEPKKYGDSDYGSMKPKMLKKPEEPSYGSEPKKYGGEPAYGSPEPEKYGDTSYQPPKQEYKSDPYQTDYGKPSYQTTPYGQNQGYQAPKLGYQPSQQGYQPPQQGYQLPQGYQPQQQVQYQPSINYQQQQMGQQSFAPQQQYGQKNEMNGQQQLLPQLQYQPQPDFYQQMGQMNGQFGQQGQYAPQQQQYQRSQDQYQPQQQMGQMNGQFGAPQQQYQPQQQTGEMNGQFGQQGQLAPSQQQYQPPQDQYQTQQTGEMNGQFNQPGQFAPLQQFPPQQQYPPQQQPGGQQGGPPGGQMGGRRGDQMGVQMPYPSQYDKSPIERDPEEPTPSPTR